MNVFKTRKLQSPAKPAHAPTHTHKPNNNHSHTNNHNQISSRNTKYLTTNPKINDYYLHARSIVEQLQEEYELGLLSKSVL